MCYHDYINTILAEPGGATLRHLQKGPCLPRLILEAFALSLLPGKGIHRTKEAPFPDLTLEPETSEFLAQIITKLLPWPMQTPSSCVLLKADGTTCVCTHGEICKGQSLWVDVQIHGHRALQCMGWPWCLKGSEWALSMPVAGFSFSAKFLCGILRSIRILNSILAF